MATHPSILGWSIPWTEEPGGLQFIGSQRVRYNWSDRAGMHTVEKWQLWNSDTALWHELRFWFHETRRILFFNGDSLSLTLTFALRKGLRSMTTLITTGALPFSNKVYSTRASTSWHMPLGANRPDGARQNSLDWQLLLCPAVQQMGRWATKWPSWHQINLLLFLCCLNVRAMKLMSGVVSKRGKGLHNCSKFESLILCSRKEMVSRWDVWVSP